MAKNILHTSAIALACAFPLTTTFAEEAKPQEESALVLETDIDSIRNWGWIVAQQTAVQMQFTEEESKAFIEGMKDGIDNPADPQSKQAELQKMGQYLSGRDSAIKSAASKVQAAEAEKFFADLASKPEVKKSDSGLLYEILEPGDEKRATAADKVTVHYRGTLVDGTTFDSSFDRGEPSEFGVSQVVPGFSEGVQLIGEGGKARLYIPSNLGYGDRVPPGGSIPPNATLIFDIEMVKITAADAG